jgi:death-on-curing protein
MEELSLENVLLFHQKLIQRTGGINGVRDMGLVQSALKRASATFDGVDLYPGIINKIVAITVSLIKNHGFIDGNKRIGIATMLLLFKLNQIEINYTQSELIDLGLRIADGTIDEKAVKDWIEEHMENKA